MTINQKDIIYFLMIDRFYGIPNPYNASENGYDPQGPKNFHGGNLQGIIDKIPYFKNLGITAIYITPCYEQMPHLFNTGEEFGYHGYWPLNFQTVDPHFYVEKNTPYLDTKHYLRDLAEELHNNGIKLILDMVVNHTGYDHPAITGAGDNPTPIQKEWFNKSNISVDHDVMQGSLAGLPDLDLDLPDVIYYHLETICEWNREAKIDGIRMDTAKHVEKLFWQKYKTQIIGLFPNNCLLGEVLIDDDIEELSNYQKYWAFSGIFDFVLQKAIKEVFIDEAPMTRFISPFNQGTGILEKDVRYSNPNMLVTFLDNHDLRARFTTWALDKYLSKNDAFKVVKLALSFLFTNRGIPQVYYGTEVGMEGRADPDNRRDFEWDKIHGIDVRHTLLTEKDLFDHLKKLISIRKENDALTCGDLVCLYVDQYILVNLRFVESNFILTAINNGRDDMPFPLNFDLSQYPVIPQKIKDLIWNATLTCKLTGENIPITNGNFNLVIKGKSALIMGE